MPHGFMSVNTDTGAGRAFLRSLYRQYADWGVDFGTLIGYMSFFLIGGYMSFCYTVLNVGLQKGDMSSN
jgi:hypothetical protein